MSPVNSLITTSNTNVNCVHPTSVPSCEVLSAAPTQSKNVYSPLPTVIKDQIQDTCIGQAILEYADRKECFYPTIQQLVMSTEFKFYVHA